MKATTAPPKTAAERKRAERKRKRRAGLRSATADCRVKDLAILRKHYGLKSDKAAIERLVREMAPMMEPRKPLPEVTESTVRFGILPLS